MGTWGTAISSNDTYADIYDDFFQQYNNGVKVPEITSSLINANKGIIDDPFDSNNFWFALATAQWECKDLDQSIYEKIAIIIESGSDLEIWRKLDADEKSIKQRKLALDKFLQKISIPRAKAKPIKKKKIIQPVHAKGDCLVFKLYNGNYGGMIALEAIQNTEYGLNLIAATDLNQREKPTVSAFVKAKVMIKTFDAHKDKPAINWFYPIKYKNVAHLFEKIGTVDVDIVYDKALMTYGLCADYDVYVINTANRQFEHELGNEKSKVNLPIKAMIKKSKWKFW